MGLTTLFFHRSAFGSCSWVDAVHLVRSVLPEVRQIACPAFSEWVDWPSLSDAGAFHTLWLPMKENEVRQSLGFVREAETRLASAADSIPVFVAARQLDHTRPWTVASGPGIIALAGE